MDPDLHPVSFIRDTPPTNTNTHTRTPTQTVEKHTELVGDFQTFGQQPKPITTKSTQYLILHQNQFSIFSLALTTNLEISSIGLKKENKNIYMF